MADKESRSGRMAFTVANLNASLRVKSYAAAVAVGDRIRIGAGQQPSAKPTQDQTHKGSQK